MKVTREGTKVNIEFDENEVEIVTANPRRSTVFIKVIPGNLSFEDELKLDGIKGYISKMRSRR